MMIQQYIKDIAKIKKYKTLIEYHKIIIKNILTTKITKPKPGKTKIQGNTIHYGHCGALYAMYSEIYIHEIYKHQKLPKNATIIDCGANIGLTTLYLHNKNPTATIHAFEPDDKSYELLQKNTENKKNIKIYKEAIDGKEKKTTFYDLNTFKGNTGNTIRKEKQWTRNKNTIKKEIKTKKITNIIKEKIDYIKIDTEGTEAEIIKDLNKQKKLKTIKEINLEYHHFDNDKNKLPNTIQILEKNNYTYKIEPCIIQNKNKNPNVITIKAKKR